MIDEEIKRLQKRIDELQRAKQFTLSQPFPNTNPQPLPDDILPPYNTRNSDWYLSRHPLKDEYGKLKTFTLNDKDNNRELNTFNHDKLYKLWMNQSVMPEPGDNKGVISTWLEQAELEHYYKLKQNHNQNDDNVSQTAG